MLPSLATVPEETVRTALRAPEGEQKWLLLEVLASPDTLNVIDRIGQGYFELIMQQWARYSEIGIHELFQLIRLLDNPRHRDALAADLVDKGLRLRQFPSEECNWADLKVIVRHLDPHSALFCTVHPDKAHWDLTNMLLASQDDRLHWLQWAKTKDGAQGRNRPKPWPRPGVIDEQREGSRVTAAPLSHVKATMAARYAANDQKAALIAGLGRRLPTKADRTRAIANAFNGRG